MFSTLFTTYFSFKMHFEMSSGIHLNLGQSKILSSGNELNEGSIVAKTPMQVLALYQTTKF